MKHTTAILLVLLLVPAFAAASLELDAITYDPVIIASGDEVDIIVQFHHEVVAANQERINDPDYTFEVFLEPDDELTRDYVSILDAVGDDLRGSILTGGYYNKRFRVKVSQTAPPGQYEFRLIGQWYFRGEPTQDEQYVRFTMPVKKEGIVLDIATYDTLPADVRPGDTYVQVRTYIENSGEKPAESIEATLESPDGLDASYTNNNRVWVGRLGAGEQKELIAYLDVDQDVEPGVYELTYRFSYKDEDKNGYSSTEKVPFLVRKSPYLVVANSSGEGLAGSSGMLTVTVRNDGTEDAESIDVRLLKESSQPFTLDVRSHYLGRLAPGEEGEVTFDLGVLRDATMGEHDFTVVLRGKGDSDEGDDNTYTFTRNARFEVSGVAPNILLWVGLGIVVLLGLLVLGRALVRPRRKRR